MPDVDTEVRRYAESLVEHVAPVSADEARRRARRDPRPRWSGRALLIAAAAVALLAMAGIVSACAWLTIPHP